MAGENTSNELTANSIYRHLDNDTNEIRLLTLLPSEAPDSPICCTLTAASLRSSSLPHYNAVSYVWGPHVFDQTITIEGHDLHVTANLASILRHLRQKDQSRLLWVDAVCINQLDQGERSQQVKLMRTIFARCERVLAWLGPDLERRDTDREEQELREGMELMKKIGEKDIETLGVLEKEYSSRVRPYLLEAHHDPEAKVTVQDSGPEQKPLMLTWKQSNALDSLFKSAAFWNRAWVVQELSCAPSASLLCPSASLDWDVVSKFLKDRPYADAFHEAMNGHARTVDKTIESNFEKPAQIEHQRWILQRNVSLQDSDPTGKSTLLDVLARFRDRRSSDPRDKVYALLGLVTEDHGIVVDYTKRVEQLFLEVTVSIINTSGNLDIICQNPFEPSEPKHKQHQTSNYLEPRGTVLDQVKEKQDWRSSLPTWVADLTGAGIDVLFAQRNIYNASRAACTVPCRVLKNEVGTLLLKGIAIGKIGPILQEKSSYGSEREVMIMYLGKNVLEGSESAIYPFPSRPTVTRNGDKGQQESVTRAYWRTILKDCTAPSRMRRFNAAEIEALDAENNAILRSRDRKILVGYKSHNQLANYGTEAMASLPVLDDEESLGLEPISRRHRGRKPGKEESDLENRSRDYYLMFTMTKNGVFLLARKHVKEGDVVVVLDGAKVPMVMREVGAETPQEGIGKTYEVVGPAYAHGFMDGEAETRVEEGRLSREEFALV